MSIPVPQAGSSTPTGTQTASLDVYAHVLQRNSAIEDVFIIDGPVQDAGPQVCTCGMCDADANSNSLIDFDSDTRSKLAGAPMLYVETRLDSDPVLLDESGVSADIEIISPRMIARTENPVTAESKPQSDSQGAQWSHVSLAALIDETLASSFDPSTFDPYDPQIAMASDLL